MHVREERSYPSKFINVKTKNTATYASLNQKKFQQNKNASKSGSIKIYSSPRSTKFLIQISSS